MKYRPIRCHCIVRINKIEEKTEGGILLIDDYKGKEAMAKEEGEILSFGEDMFPDSDPKNKPNVKVGDIVAFARYGGKSLGKDEVGNEIRVMRDIDILCVRED